MKLLPASLPAFLALFATTLSAQGGPAKVSSGKVESRALHPVFEVLGEVEAIRRVELGSELEGKVEALHVDAGDRVEKDALLVTLEHQQRKIALLAAKARLASAAAQLAEYRAGSRKEDIEEAEASVAEARALLTDAVEDLARWLGMRKDEIASEREISRARALEKSRKAILRQRLAKLERIRKGPRAEQIARAEASVAERKADVARIEDEIDKSVIEAPFGGVVTKKATERGAYLRPGNPVLTLLQMDPIEIRIAVPERMLARVKKGQKLPFTLDAYPGKRFEATVHRVVPDADRQSRTIPVRLRVANSSRQIVPGMLARALIPASDGKPTLVVPWDAVVRTPRGKLIYRIVNGKAMPVPVQLGARKDSFVEVRGPLEAGQVIATKGNERLFPGAPVLIVSDTPKKGAPGKGPAKGKQDTENEKR